MLVGFFAALGIAQSADQGYALLEPLPGTETAPGTSVGLSGYLEAVFAFGISLAGIFAVLMIVIGGIEYITAYGNPGRAETAKNRIWQALIGLLLVVSAWLILYTINPDLTKGQLNIPPLPSGLKTLQPSEALKLVK